MFFISTNALVKKLVILYFLILGMAKIRGMAAKTLVRQSLKAMLFGSDKAFDMATKGMAGERQVARVLKDLPDGWRVWHDVDIDGENIDHVVASSKGVFVIEVKNYSGSVLATPKGLFTHGGKSAKNKVTSQVWRQVYKLNDLLQGQFIKPVLVFLNDVKGDRAAKIPCVQKDDLLSYLRAQRSVLSYADAKELFATLDGLTK